MSTYTYPHTIDNGGGERLTFLRRVPGSAGDRLEVENTVKPGSGPPMHVHYLQEEALTVEAGRIGYERPGEPAQFAEAGETVVFPPGDWHRFWNPGEEDLRCTGYVEPADNIEYFLTSLYESQRKNEGSRPDPFDAALPGKTVPERVRHCRDAGGATACALPGLGGGGTAARQVRQVRRRPGAGQAVSSSSPPAIAKATVTGDQPLPPGVDLAAGH